MGQRGNLKLPKHLRPVGDGDAAETMADSVPPTAPERAFGFPSEDAELSALWDELLPVLDEAGLVSRGDGPTVELALRHFLAARRASDALLRDEVVVDDPAHGGTKKNPAGAEFRQQSALFLEYVKQMGMSFAARARIPAKEPEPDQVNPFTVTGS